MRRVVGTVVIMSLGLFVAACSDGAPATVAEKNGSGELRTDLEPLTSRFPNLTSTEAAHWMSGTFGDGSVPGPSTYWIDAVVTLPASEHAALAELGALAPGSLPDDFVSELTESVPAGELRTSPELEEAFSPDEFWSDVLLVDDGATLVLSTTFE